MAKGGLRDVDRRSTGGLKGRPPVSKPLSTKAFQEKTGGWEVKTLIRIFNLRLKNTFVRKQKEILISFVFRSLIRTFETNLEGTHARKNANKFGFLLT